MAKRWRQKNGERAKEFLTAENAKNAEVNGSRDWTEANKGNEAVGSIPTGLRPPAQGCEARLPRRSSQRRQELPWVNASTPDKLNPNGVASSSGCASASRHVDER